MSPFRPALWPTLVGAPALVVFLVLGTWQVPRLHWKGALIAARGAELLVREGAIASRW